jgi:hypothetical protein
VEGEEVGIRVTAANEGDDKPPKITAVPAPMAPKRSAAKTMHSIRCLQLLDLDSRTTMPLDATVFLSFSRFSSGQT